MPKVYTSSIINASTNIVWELIRDFNNMPAWHSLIKTSEIEAGLSSCEIGCVRSFYLTDNTHLREKLLALSDLDYKFAYQIEGEAMGLSNYTAELTLYPITNGDKCLGVWTAEFNCQPGLEDEKIHNIGQGVFQTGFDAIEAAIANQ